MPFQSYEINFRTLVTHLIDGLRRDEFTIAWCYSLLGYIETRYEQYLTFIADQEELLMYAPGYTMQVEALLNSKFGSDGIYITNNKAGVLANYAYSRPDSRNLYAHERMEPYKNSHLYTRGAHDLGFRNFTVHVPVALVYDAVLMEAYIRLYKPAGLTFEIVTY